MVYKITSPRLDHVRVVFELPASLWAQSVDVVGDFTGRDPEVALPLRQDRDGVWRALIDLPIGCRCHFRYRIDGRWCCDSHAHGSMTHYAENAKSLIDTFLTEAEPLLLSVHLS